MNPKKEDLNVTDLWIDLFMYTEIMVQIMEKHKLSQLMTGRMEYISLFLLFVFYLSTSEGNL